MNGDITLVALCHRQRASKVISPFIIFEATETRQLLNAAKHYYAKCTPK